MLARLRPALSRANPYAVLGIRESGDVTVPEIKRAFHKRAAQLHPDVGGDEEKFKELGEAFEALMKSRGVARDGAADGAAASGGKGFYDTAHARWANDRASERDGRSHYDHDPHTAKHGEGLGDEYSCDAGWDTSRGRWRNYSTEHFYRPYQSDFSSPFGHGFTPEEIKAAEEENRRAKWWAVLKYAFLCGGLAFVVALHQWQDRIGRATRARDQGYADPAYWAAVEEERRRFSVLRLGPQWWEKPLEPLWGAKGSEDEEAPAKSLQQVRSGTGGGPSPRPLAVSHRNKPVNPSGVRSSRPSPPKGERVFRSDQSLEPEDIDDSNP